MMHMHFGVKGQGLQIKVSQHLSEVELNET